MAEIPIEIHIIYCNLRKKNINQHHTMFYLTLSLVNRHKSFSDSLVVADFEMKRGKYL